MKKFSAFLVYCFLLFRCSITEAQTIYTILPSQADSNVVHNNYNNYVMINNSIPHLNKLLVFFPGTGAQPQAYIYFLQTAANLGYHTIGLTYNNDTTIETLCTDQPSDCKELARAEVFYGKNYSDVENVDSSECIRTRLVSLLKYLEVNYPTENWGQYLNVQDSVIWSQVCVAGHSQGSGMASIIAYWYPVYRGVFLATGGDWYDSTNNVDPWMEMYSQTPASKKYSFTHRQDELFWGSLNHAPIIWDTLQLGTYLDYDTLSGNYYNAHCFTSYDTTAIPHDSIMFHNCVATDNYTPRISGTLLFQPLWQYMLGDTMLTGIGTLTVNNSINVYPNPSSGIFNIKSILLSGQYLLEVYNILGEKVYSNSDQLLAVSHQLISIDLSSQPNGVYLYRILSDDGELIGQGKLAIQK
jgi:hypothetical protein